MPVSRSYALPFLALIATASWALALSSCASVDASLKGGRLQEAETLIRALPEDRRKDGYSRLGAAYLGKGDLEGAGRYFAMGGDKAALMELAPRLLQSGSYEAFLQAWREARKTRVFLDEFAGNARAWNIRSDAKSTSTISEGRLAFQRSPDPGSSYIWASAGLDPALDFKVEAVVTRTSGKEESGAFLAWGLKDADANFQLGVSGKGNWVYGGYADGVWRARLDWSSSPAVNAGFASNRLAVLKVGAALRFYVNDVLVGSAPFEGLPGDRVGLCLNSSVGIEAESFLVERFPSAAPACEQIGDAAAAAGDEAAAVAYFALAGNTDKIKALARSAAEGGRPESALAALRGLGRSEKAARLDLAASLADLGKRAEAADQLARAGWLLGEGLSRVAYQETFSDNARGWAVRDDGSARLLVNDGSYRVESFEEGGRNSWNSVPIDPESDFRLEARFRKLSGADDQTYSLIWGFSETKNKQDFGVSGEGCAEYGYFADSKWKPVFSLRACPAVRKGNAENLLAVVRTGDRLRFFVNGTGIGEAPYRGLKGDSVGFSLYSKMAVEVDDLKVTEYPPDFAVEIARTELYASRQAAFHTRAAAMYLERGAYGQALASFLEIGDSVGAMLCHGRLGAEAAAAGNSAGAVEHYLKAEPSEEAFRALASANEGLGLRDKAEDASSSLADILFAGGRRDEALALYRGLSRPALLDAAGSRFLGAGDFAAAASLFKASGNSAGERQGYGKEAERLAAAGSAEAAAALYRRAGLEAKAAELEKKLVLLSPFPLLGAAADRAAVNRPATAAGLRIVDNGGFAVDIGSPRFQYSTPRLGPPGKEVELSLDTTASAAFNWAKKTVAVQTLAGERLSLAMPEEGLGEYSIIGVVYQADLICDYEIALADVKSIARIETAAAKGEAPYFDGSLRCELLDLKGNSYSLKGLEFYAKGAFDTGYGYNFGFGPGIEGSALERVDYLGLALGKGSYRVPLSQVEAVSFKDKYLLSAKGLRCPFLGAPSGLVAVAGEEARGRLAMYPSSIAELRIAKAPGLSSAKDREDDAQGGTWSVACSKAAGATPYLNLGGVASEIYSPRIDWDATDSALAFRAALADYREYGLPDADASDLVWDKTLSSEAVPIAVGAACFAVPFRNIKEFGVDAKGAFSLVLRDGSVMKGSPYKNWTGLKGNSGQGAASLPRDKFPARIALLDAGTLFAKDVAVSGSLEESQEHPYGQKGYLEWRMRLKVENASGAAIRFGSDLLIMDSLGGQEYDGAFVSYDPGLPAEKPGVGDFLAEAHAYSLSNFESWWADGTMRGFRNGGTYVFGDPPEHALEPTICNTSLAAGASAAIDKAFRQGSWLRAHDRVIVALPAVSSASGKYRLILSFSKPDPTKDQWILKSIQPLALARQELLAAIKAAKGDAALEVLALNWLAEVDPAAAAPVLDQNIRARSSGLTLVASIQLLGNRGLKPGAEALGAIKALAAKGEGWSSSAAKRFLGGGE